MGRLIYIIVILVAFSAFSVDAEARSGRQNQVPHGSSFGCDVCHTAAGGLNDFGFESFDYTNGGTVNWGPELAGLDSDRDGYTNGEELGDPTGSWNPGDGSPGGAFSNPGVRADGLCGNGNLEGEEECESGALQGASCDSLGLGSGSLSCSAECRFDTSGCDTCGDGAIQGGEECDGADLAGNTCESLGMGTGSLTCTGCGYNTVGCSGPEPEATPDTCGDGIRQTGEACDGSDLAGETCATRGFAGGTLGCQVRCSFDTSSCTGGTGTTGNNDTGGEGSADTTGGYTYGGANDGSSAPQSMGDGDKIELDGYACSTSAHQRPADPSLLALLFAGLFWMRRRRDRG